DAAGLPQRPLELVGPERPRPRRPRALRAVDAGRHDGSAAAPDRLLEGHDPALTLYDNAIGIALDGSSEALIAGVAHRMYIMNDTFAWNGIGIWTHDAGPQSPGIPAQHASLIVNNIFNVEPNPNVEEAPVTGWDFDGEGFGNPRIVLPNGFPDPVDDVGDID